MHKPALSKLGTKRGARRTGLPGVGGGTVPSACALPVPLSRDKSALVIAAPKAAAMAQLEQPNNYMTSVLVFGEGASGPHPAREPEPV